MAVEFPTLFRCAVLLACLTLSVTAAVAADPGDDPYLEYEKIDSPEALAWVEKENAKTISRLAGNERYDDYYAYILKQLNADDRIVYPSFYQGSDVVRNFWRDAKNPQGIVRETTIDGFMSGKYDWRTLVDLDEISRAEGKTWVYDGTSYPFKRNDIGMLSLSDGGKDASVVREYNYLEKRFVEDGFRLDESKSSVGWFDADTLLVASAFGEDEQTTSGYPRVVKLWKRGTPFADASTVFSVNKDDMLAGAGSLQIDDDTIIHLFVRQIDFYNSEYHLFENGSTRRIDLPSDSEILGVHKKLVFVWLKSDWEQGGTTFKAGSVVHFPYAELTAEAKAPVVFYEPDANSSFESLSMTKDYVYLNINRDVQSKIYQYALDNGEWSTKELPLTPYTTAGIVASPREKGFVLYYETGFLHPTRLFRLDEKAFAVELVQSLPERFDADAYEVNQYFAVSADATRIPYFVVHKKGMATDGTNPVLQDGYGGFMVTNLPGYLAIAEHCWLRLGGVYVLANIRGGGEYGPSWHEQAQGARRHKAFEDFIAVSEDLVARGITSPGHLGIKGGSNGGLLTGAVMVMRPDLFNAVVIAVPLLDMLRYHLLPPGASWIGEYGNPEDPEVAAAIAKYSPYQNLKKDVAYPAPFLETSSKDDRVHPGHARKFAKRLEEYGLDFYYHEDTEGGHSGDSNPDQVARTLALEYVYLWTRLFPQ